VILSADPDRPYDRPYLSKEYLRGEIELSKVYLHEEDAYSKNRIELRLGQQVTGGALAGRRLALDGGTEIGYDTLILATGGSPRWLPGVPRAGNVFTLRSLRDSQAIHDALQASARVLLIGAGFIGAEVGASARTKGKDVLMVEAAQVPLSRALGEEVGQVYASIHRSRGVAVRTGTTVEEWHGSGDRVVGVTLSDGSREEVDMVLLGVGGRPRASIAPGTSHSTGIRSWNEPSASSTGRSPRARAVASQDRWRESMLHTPLFRTSGLTSTTSASSTAGTPRAWMSWCGVAIARL
jgi:3-phenylpropionate/trans-cinnamate dioxygenase ferredoxin reductase subunit